MTTNALRRPAAWTPPYPGWSGLFEKQDAPVIFGYIACQCAVDGAEAAEFRDWWTRVAALPDGPIHTEWASYRDARGDHNVVALCYWLDVAAHERWWESPGVGSWWIDPAREQSTVGYWREMNVVAPGNFETVFSSKNPVGIAVASDGFSGEVENHAYWGSMRDRIPASSHDAFTGSLEALRPIAQSPKSERINLRLSNNLAMIRSGQDWRECSAAERSHYLSKVHPVMTVGMDYLRDNPEDSGCLSCRFMTSQDKGSEDQVTFGSAVFRDLADLEAWAEHHPTHVAIFGAFLAMVRTFNGVLDLRLWHEVVIIDGPSSIYEYVNCSDQTGALQWLGRSDH